MIEAAGNLEAKADSDIRKETGGVLMGQREEADLEELSKVRCCSILSCCFWFVCTLCQQCVL